MNQLHNLSTEELVDSARYVRSVLRMQTANCTPDGDLDPPAGGRCTTRSGFRAWLKRAEQELTARRLRIHPPNNP